MPKILIIEDEVELVRVLRFYLEGSNFTIFSAGKGDHGFAVATVLPESSHSKIFCPVSSFGV